MTLPSKLLIAVLALSCGKHKHTAGEVFSDIEQKASLYCELSKQQYTENKFVVDECDSAGFTSLYSLGCSNNNVDLSVFSSESGEMFRNPNKDCYPTRSKSGFSKDHVLMRLVAAVGQGDKVWPKSFLEYVTSNNGFFCDGIDAQTKISRCLISPFLASYLSKASGGSSLLAESEDSLGERYGFESHLHVLAIWLRGRVDGSIDDIDLGYLETYARREPLNALYQAAAYRYGKATKEEVINAFGSSHWPNDRLPSSTEHCSGYLFQRDMSSAGDWDPCPEAFQVYSGTDYSFAAYVLRN